MGGLTPEEGGDQQLPAEIEPSGPGHRFVLTVGDDPASAKRDGVLHTVTLRVILSEYDPVDQALCLRLNDEPLENPRAEDDALVFTDVPARQGENQLVVSVEGHSAKTVRVEGIEVLVAYSSDS